MKESTYRADLIRAEMGRQDINIEGLARLSGLTRHTVRAIRNGYAGVRLSTLWAVADALNLKMSDLFAEENAEGVAA